METPRLSLRTWSPDDAAEAFRIWGDPEVMRHVDDGTPQASVEATRASLGRAIRAYEQHGVCLWPVIEKHSGALIGACGFHLFEGGPDLELAYHFARQYWGRGYATEAAAACMEFGFRTLGAPRIVAATQPGNEASTRVLEKLGFRRLGLDEHGETLYEAAPPA
jgi:ribosomal-protein-alanine N-acetyltransferase